MVYLLWFVQENADAEDMELLLGAYSSEAAAKAAINGNDPQALLQTAHEELIARKQAIEAEIARMNVLQSEHEAVTTQLAAVDQAMGAFRKV